MFTILKDTVKLNEKKLFNIHLVSSHLRHEFTNFYIIYCCDVYRVFLPIIAQYIFFSAAHGTSSKVDHILGHKASLNKYKKIEITPCILSNRNKTRT
jgi:hypothetical protein